MDTTKLRSINGWNQDYDGRNICYWEREIPDSVGGDNWKGFALTIAKRNPDDYRVSIDVMFHGGGGDLLSATYDDTTHTLEEAMVIGENFVQEVEQEYNL